jgi:hypothetical protein
MCERASAAGCADRFPACMRSNRIRRVRHPAQVADVAAPRPLESAGFEFFCRLRAPASKAAVESAGLDR